MVLLILAAILVSSVSLVSSTPQLDKMADKLTPGDAGWVTPVDNAYGSLAKLTDMTLTVKGPIEIIGKPIVVQKEKKAHLEFTLKYASLELKVRGYRLKQVLRRLSTSVDEKFLFKDSVDIDVDMLESGDCRLAINNVKAAPIGINVAPDAMVFQVMTQRLSDTEKDKLNSDVERQVKIAFQNVVRKHILSYCAEVDHEKPV